MLTLIQGNLNPVNMYRLEKIESQYESHNVLRYSNVSYAIDVTKHSKFPIIGDKYLVVIDEDADYKNFKQNLQHLLGCKDKPNADYIWCLGSKYNKSIDYIQEPKVETILLYKTYKEDFTKFLANEVPYLAMNEKLLKHTAKRVKYNYQKIILYIPQLQKELNLNMYQIDKIIKETALLDFEEMIYHLLHKDPVGIKAYYKYKQRYSARWLNESIAKTLNKIITLQLDVAKNKKTPAQLLGNKSTAAYYDLVMNTKVMDIIYLQYLLDTGKGVELYLIGENKIFPESIMDIPIGKEDIYNGTSKF